MNIALPKIKNLIRIIAVVLGLIGLFIFWKTTSEWVPAIEAETSQKASENSGLAVTETNLATLYNDMQYYIDETKRLHDETEEVLTEFPTFMYLEDKILYADTLLKTDLHGYNLTNFAYGQSEYIMNVYFGVSEDDQSNMLELYSVGLTGTYSDLTYTQIKEILDYGLNSPQRFVITTLTMGYNSETGYIGGQFGFKTYFIPGQSTPYEFPQSVIDGLGNSDRIDNLFGARQDAVIINPNDPT